LSQQGQKAFNASTQHIKATNSNVIAPMSVLRQESKAQEQTIKHILEQSKLPELEATKVETLANISATPYMLTDPTAYQEQIAAITQASSVIEVKQVDLALREKLELDHHNLFTSALVQACANAAISIGFDVIETPPSPLPSIVRVIATDKAGRNLITEINVDPAHDAAIETEVIGVSDGSCNEIMDQFDAALEAQRVRSSPPARKFTGGVCETAAARAFLRQRPQKGNQMAVTNTLCTDDTKRRQRLNTGTTQKQR
jgi:hypothetical protein